MEYLGVLLAIAGMIILATKGLDITKDQSGKKEIAWVLMAVVMLYGGVIILAGNLPEDVRRDLGRQLINGVPRSGI